MKSKQDMYARTEAITVSVRASTPRAGNTHTYVLNGTLMRDVLVDGKWVTSPWNRAPRKRTRL
ncbi:hypothetical protein [Paraburkholderia sp. 22B1P]|uniref:hypothetical protein n=1 Tax=Paraburkholderia sp. 22B1P TaxID=3080498 RepID=UPI00308AF26A|nr:hypothetical protein PBP221_81740 [Paraburkholderia sp. 22B1P]